MEKVLKYIESRLNSIKGFSLEPEVVAYALKAMKENPELSIEDAFEVGCEEFDV